MTKTSHREWAFEYLPYTAQDGREIPCFRIYPEDSPEAFIAQTNEDLPLDVQRDNALLMAGAPRLLAAAALVIDRWVKGDLADAVRQLDAAVISATGGSL
jgi:hypothetical protein